MECAARFARRLLAPARLQGIVSRSKVTSSLDYCVDLVRQHDYENFLATLLLSASVRSPSLVLRAFNVEVARVQDQTTDRQTAEFRLQFWRDILEKIYKKEQDPRDVPAHPIAQELFKICSSHKLQKRQLDKLISSRNVYMKTKYFRTLEEVERYSEETVSTLFYLILAIADIKNVHADHAASHLGKAQGIANILRSVQVSSSHKMVTLPLEVLTQHGVSQEDVLRCRDTQAMRDVAFQLAARANSHLDKARSISVPGKAAQVFLPATAVASYLERLQEEHFNIFDKSLLRRRPTLPFLMYYKSLFKKY